jgi:anaerobic magnesium-protoporphyrin IX monomethyl ester cyclase
MKVCLVRPYSDTFIVSPPFGLGYLVSAVRLAGHDAGIIDALLLGCTEEDHVEKTLTAIAEHKPDIIGVQAFSCDYGLLRALVSRIRADFPKTTLIMGGPHPSGVKSVVFSQYPELDYAFAGEGEKGLPMLMDALEKGDTNTKILLDIPGLIFPDVEGDYTSNPVAFEEDIDQWGQPAWDLMDPRIYPNAPHQGLAKGFPVAPIIATRGCPFRCTFCSVLTVTGRKPRYRKIEAVVDEIEMLVNKYGVKEIHIEDDIFTLSKRFVMNFVDEVKRRNLKFHWHCSSGVRLDSLDEELIEAMDSAGCYTYTVAIESGVDKILADMDKHLKTEKVFEQIQLLNKMGHKPVGLFMLGYPTETWDDIMETIRFSLSLDLRRAQFAIFHPLPGSPIFEEMMANGDLDDIVWTNLKPEQVAFKHPHLSERQLLFLQKYAFLRFHLRPKIVWATLKDMRESGNAAYVIKRIFSYLTSGWSWPGKASDTA